MPIMVNASASQAMRGQPAMNSAGLRFMARIVPRYATALNLVAAIRGQESVHALPGIEV